MPIAEEEIDSADVCGMSGPCWWMGLNTEASAAVWEFKGHLVPSLPPTPAQVVHEPH